MLFFLDWHFSYLVSKAQASILNGLYMPRRFVTVVKPRTLDMRVFSVEVGFEPPNQLTYITYVLRDVISVTT